tara:strand:- start:650 stop:961 length:312 start_codon:yes stop_codon:yes gene_type:complete
MNMSTPLEKAWLVLKNTGEDYGDVSASLDTQAAEERKRQMEQARKRAALSESWMPHPSETQKPHENATMPDDPAQMQLPPALTAGAQVGDKDFRELDFNRVRL